MINSKSSSMLNILAVFCICTSLFASGFGSDHRRYEEKPPTGIEELEKKLDVLVKLDLKILLPVLHDIINFYLDSKNDIDLNSEYGIFLLNVIMKRLLEEKGPRLPKSISYSLKHLLEKNGELMNFFKNEVDHDRNSEDILLKKVLTLYSNESVWMSQMKKFDIMHKKKKHLKIIQSHVSEYKNWNFYEQLSYNTTPTPRQADNCMRIVAEVPIDNTMLHKCQVPYSCINVLYNGSDIGYALTHRLMMLQFAHFGRQCHFVSEEKDRELELRLCQHALQEAEFISNNDYMYGDLMLDQITLCALIGHFEFLKRSWLIQLVRFRTKDGCFAQKLHHRERRKPKDSFTSEVPWHLSKDIHAPLLSGWCEAEVTSGALTTIILAIKYLLEAFY